MATPQTTAPPKPTPYASAADATAGLADAFGGGAPLTPEQDAAIRAAASLVPTTVPNEPSVLSSRAGAQTFQSKVQPVIDAANATVKTARDTAVAKNAAATVADANAPEPLPPDVQSEIDASKDPVQKAFDDQLAQWDQEKEDLKTTYGNLTLSANSTAAANVQQLQNEWDERRKLLIQSNKMDLGNWNQQFIRTGQAEYSPGMTGTFLSEKEQAGDRKVQDLDNEYNGKIAAINTALEQKNYELAASLTKDLNTISDNALAAIKDNAKTVAANNKTIKDKLIQVSRENTISDLVRQGITDPKDIFDFINFSNNGQQLGDVTLDDIDKALKIVNPPDSMSGLSADYKTFKTLQDTKDPIVNGMNYFDYLRAVGNASRKGTDESDNAFKFSQTQTSQLLSGGFTQSDVQNLQNDVATHGLDATIAGLPQTQADLIRRVLAGSDTVTNTAAGSVFTRDYLAKLYGIPDTDETRGGFLGLGGETGKQQLDDLMTRITTWQKAGYTDKDIQGQLDKSSSGG